MDETLTQVAAQHAGLFTTEQARRVGVGEYALARLVQTGRVSRVMLGVYVLAESDPRRQPGRDRDHVRSTQAHLLLGRAGLLRYPDAVLSHETALIACGLPVPTIHTDQAYIARPTGRRLHTRSLVISPQTASVTTTEYGPASVPAAAIIDVAMARGVLLAVPAADQALHERLIAHADLEAEAHKRVGSTGCARARALLDLADDAAESPGESLARTHLRLAGYDVESQVKVRDARGRVFARLDLRIHGEMIGIEFDGKIKYNTRADLWAEKRREDELRRMGWTIVRLTWADVMEPRRMLALIAQGTRAAHRVG